MCIWCYCANRLHKWVSTEGSVYSKTGKNKRQLCHDPSQALRWRSAARPDSESSSARLEVQKLNPLNEKHLSLTCWWIHFRRLNYLRLLLSPEAGEEGPGQIVSGLDHWWCTSFWNTSHVSVLGLKEWKQLHIMSQLKGGENENGIPFFRQPGKFFHLIFLWFFSMWVHKSSTLPLCTSRFVSIEQTTLKKKKSTNILPHSILLKLSWLHKKQMCFTWV